MASATELSVLFKVASGPSKRLADNKMHPSSLFGHSCLSLLSIFERLMPVGTEEFNFYPNQILLFHLF